MDISVIVCTYNRCNLLPKALASIAASARLLPSGIACEVIVVDNNSTDETREVVERFVYTNLEDRARFKYVFEPMRGKSHALNRAITIARGDILAFMDDDATVEAHWLDNLTRNIRGNWVGAGGRVIPLFSGVDAIPRWLDLTDKHCDGPLVSFAPKSGEQLNEPPFGVNMAFRKSVFEKHGGFKTELGPPPLIRGEDSEFGRRLLNAGEFLRYEPTAIVFHPVPKERLTKEYFLYWWFDKGRSLVHDTGARRALPMFRSMGWWALKWICTPGLKRFSRKLTVWEKAGEISEWMRSKYAA